MPKIFCSTDYDIPYENVSYIEKRLNFSIPGIIVVMTTGATVWLSKEDALSFQKGFYHFYDPQPVQWTEEAVEVERQKRRAARQEEGGIDVM